MNSPLPLSLQERGRGEFTIADKQCSVSSVAAFNSSMGSWVTGHFLIPVELFSRIP